MTKLNAPDLAKVEVAVDNMLKTLNLNVKDEHLKDTPRRIAKMFVNELLHGLYNDPPEITCFEAKSSTPVIVDNISVRSLCSHHFLPFYGYAVVYYSPKDKIAGLSKFSRIVNYFAARPQVQERLTTEIAHYLTEQLKPWFLFVGLKCRHMCLATRGAKDSAAVMTTYTLVHDVEFQNSSTLSDVTRTGLDLLSNIHV